MNTHICAWPIAMIASLLIFAGLGVYFHESGGFSIFGRKGLVGKTLEHVNETINTLKPTISVKQITASEIKNVLAVDEWTVAKIESEISVSEKRDRLFNTTLSFYSDSLPVTYTYTVPVNDRRWNIRFFSSSRDGGDNVDLILIEAPDLEFSSNEFNCDISKLKINSENFRWNYTSGTNKALQESIMAKLQHEYQKNGTSEPHLNIARQKAEQTITIFTTNRLKEHSLQSDKEPVFMFKWIPKNHVPKISNLAKIAGVLK